MRNELKRIVLVFLVGGWISGCADPGTSATITATADEDLAIAPPSALAACDASQQLVDTLTVSSDGTEVASTAPFQAGVSYRIEASGTYQWGGCDPGSCPGGAACSYLRLGDAQYRTDDCWSSLQTSPAWSGIQLYMNGAQVDWGPFSQDHVYSLSIDGSAGPPRFRIHDCPTCYGDNAGQLTVRIYVDRKVRGRSCTDVIRDANGLSDIAMNNIDPHFSRSDYTTFFDAVECRTGVPADMLRALALGEGLGTLYADPYPRQFVEPCDVFYRQDGVMASPTLFDRYYGGDALAHGENWPLLALDAGLGRNITLPTTRAGYPPTIPAQLNGQKTRCQSPPVPVLHADPLWAALWSTIPHVTLGDDRHAKSSGADTFGLGVIQVTFYVRDLIREDTGLALIDDLVYKPTSQSVFPFGGGDVGPDASGRHALVMEPQQNQMDRVIRDPQYNILLAAQLAATKWQQIMLHTPKRRFDEAVGECLDKDYGRILTMNSTAWPSSKVEENFVCAVGSFKARSANCEPGPHLGLGQRVITRALNHRLNDADRRCFCPDDNYRITASRCEVAFEEAFAKGCMNLDAYCQGVAAIPDGDPCKPMP